MKAEIIAIGTELLLGHITLKTIARALDKKLIYKDAICQDIEDHFKKRHNPLFL